MQGHLDILENAIENALDTQLVQISDEMYPPVEASGGQEEYYVR